MLYMALLCTRVDCTMACPDACRYMYTFVAMMDEESLSLSSWGSQIQLHTHSWVTAHRESRHTSCPAEHATVELWISQTRLFTALQVLNVLHSGSSK